MKKPVVDLISTSILGWGATILRLMLTVPFFGIVGNIGDCAMLG
jgi:hypothetical protein